MTKFDPNQYFLISNRNFVYHSIDVDKIINYNTMNNRGSVKTVWMKNASRLIQRQIRVYFKVLTFFID